MEKFRVLVQLSLTGTCLDFSGGSKKCRLPYHFIEYLLVLIIKNKVIWYLILESKNMKTYFYSDFSQFLLLKYPSLFRTQDFLLSLHLLSLECSDGLKTISLILAMSLGSLKFYKKSCQCMKLKPH